MILVEHDMDAIFAAADTLTVLVSGRVLAHGAPADIRRDPKVRKAYLGRHGDAKRDARSRTMTWPRYQSWVQPPPYPSPLQGEGIRGATACDLASPVARQWLLVAWRQSRPAPSPCKGEGRGGGRSPGGGWGSLCG